MNHMTANLLEFAADLTTNAGRGKLARFVREGSNKARDMERAKQRRDKRHERTAYAAY